jgi:hypothetical protein
MAGRDPVEAAYERRIRIASEVATWGIAGILVASAAIPTTEPISRYGLLFSAGVLALFCLLWFHLIPERIFGRLRFTIGSSITQAVGAFLLVLTGGANSPYYVFFLFPTLATTFAMRIASTLVVGAIALISYLMVLATDELILDRSSALLDVGVIRTSALIALIAMTSHHAHDAGHARRAPSAIR